MTDTSLLRMIGIAQLGLLVALWYFRVLSRFPFLAAHLLVDGLGQLLGGWLGQFTSNWNTAVYAWMQVPRMMVRLAMVWEVWQWSTGMMEEKEKRGLTALCLLGCLLTGLSTLFIYRVVEVDGRSPQSVFEWASIGRQYLLLFMATWLGILSLYLFYVRSQDDHNLVMYRLYATARMWTMFVGATSTPGGLLYCVLPWKLDVWLQFHSQVCWYTLLLLGLLVLLKPERPENPDLLR